MNTRTWKNIYWCVRASAVYDHIVISRHASRGDGNYLISSGIMFFIFFPRRRAQVEIMKLPDFGRVTEKRRSGNYIIVYNTIRTSSVIVSPNNHHNNRPGRSVRRIKKRNEIIIHKKKNGFTLVHACAPMYVCTLLLLLLLQVV